MDSTLSIEVQSFLDEFQNIDSENETLNEMSDLIIKVN